MENVASPGCDPGESIEQIGDFVELTDLQGELKTVAEERLRPLHLTHLDREKAKGKKVRGELPGIGQFLVDDDALLDESYGPDHIALSLRHGAEATCGNGNPLVTSELPCEREAALIRAFR